MSTTLETKLARVESSRGVNHGQSVLKDWLLHDFHTCSLPGGIHIAGTNGKGSVTTWLEELLRVKQQTTGSFVSPHLIHHGERFHLDGRPISLARWETLYDHWADVFEARQMTMFEMDLWCALDLFEQEKPDWILMETGLGGARDATTACSYPRGIITQIGMDHMAFLGNTRAEIAREKAGIIQEGMQVVTAESDPDCLQIFEEVCTQKNASLHRIDRSLDLTPFWSPLLPAYQKDNFLCALKTLELAGFRFDSSELALAVSRFHWSGRFQILRNTPLLLLDGAHNPDGIQALCASLRTWGQSVEQIYFSVLADKQADSMIETLQSLCPSITLVFFDEKRLYDLQTLADRWNLSVITLPEMMDQIETGNRNTLICGSLYFAGDVLRAWTDRKEQSARIKE